jgi:hypothetical protein
VKTGNPGNRPIRFTLPKPENRPPALPANWFHFAAAGDHVQLLVGYADAQVLAEAAGRGSSNMAPEIVARISMTMSSFVLLRQQLLEISNGLAARGVPLDQLSHAAIRVAADPNQ